MVLRGDVTPGAITASTSAVTFNGTTVDAHRRQLRDRRVHRRDVDPHRRRHPVRRRLPDRVSHRDRPDAHHLDRRDELREDRARPSTGLYLTRICGDTDVDTFQFGDATGVAGGTTLDSPGYILLGGKTRVYGSQSPTVAGRRRGPLHSSTTCRR